MKKIAILLAGCGRLDGSEIHESVLTLLSIQQCGANYQCFSLDTPQHHVSNHFTEQDVAFKKRNMLIESARVARGAVKDLCELDVTNFDALIIPGGNGAAFNLFNFATHGKNFSVVPQVKNICLAFTNNKKPVGYICIAPVMIPKIYNEPINLTIGNDIGIASLLTKLGAIHHDCNVNEICIDEKHKIVTTPAYMLADNILDTYKGIAKRVEKIIDLA